MAVSILGRVTGVGLATLGAALFVWWLVALAGGPEAYQSFSAWLGWIGGAGYTQEREGLLSWVSYFFGAAIGVGLTWAAFQHSLSGLRYLVMDIGAGFELRTNKFWSVMTMAGAVLLTMVTWGLIIRGRL